MEQEQAKKIKVFIVDDSMVFRSFLSQKISADPRFDVVGTAVNAFDASKQIPVVKPDVVTLDIEMPGMSGLEFLQKLLPEYPVPVILVSSLNIRVFDALAAGAVDFVRKSAFYDTDYVDNFVYQLKPKLVIASRAKVRIPSQKHASAEAGAASKAPAAANVPQGHRNLIAIGASTGGTEAILEVVKDLPVTTPGIVVTQHMPSGFTQMYAERLNKICKMEVREAKNGDKVHPGLILIAPGGQQMRVIKRGTEYWVTCADEEKVNGHAPSVDVLFNSVAQHAGDQAIGVILTGMGSDGSVGLLRMRKNGAYTIGQDEASSIVYGMPMEAFKIGAVTRQADLGEISKLIQRSLA